MGLYFYFKPAGNPGADPERGNKGTDTGAKGRSNPLYKYLFLKVTIRHLPSDTSACLSPTFLPCKNFTVGLLRSSLCLFLWVSESSCCQQGNQPISVQGWGWDSGKRFIHLEHLLKDALPGQAGTSPRQWCPPKFGKGI